MSDRVTGTMKKSLKGGKSSSLKFFSLCLSSCHLSLAQKKLLQSICRNPPAAAHTKPSQLSRVEESIGGVLPDTQDVHDVQGREDGVFFKVLFLAVKVVLIEHT